MPKGATPIRETRLSWGRRFRPYPPSSIIEGTTAGVRLPLRDHGSEIRLTALSPDNFSSDHGVQAIGSDESNSRGLRGDGLARTAPGDASPCPPQERK